MNHTGGVAPAPHCKLQLISQRRSNGCPVNTAGIPQCHITGPVDGGCTSDHGKRYSNICRCISLVVGQPRRNCVNTFHTGPGGGYADILGCTPAGIDLHTSFPKVCMSVIINTANCKGSTPCSSRLLRVAPSNRIGTCHCHRTICAVSVKGGIRSTGQPHEHRYRVLACCNAAAGLCIKENVVIPAGRAGNSICSSNILIITC